MGAAGRAVRVSVTAIGCSMRWPEIRTRKCSSDKVGSIVCELSLRRLGNLTSLDLSGNLLNGFIPSCLSSMSQLRVVKLSSMDIASTVSRLLSVLHDGVESVDVMNNPLLLGQLPTSAASVPAGLRRLVLANTGVFGGFPSWFSSFDGLEVFSAIDTALRGTLPSHLPGNMRVFVLGSSGVVSGLSSLSQIVGPIPKTYCNATGLQVLVLRGICAGGRLPSCESGWANLTVLDVSSSFVGGALPSTSELWTSLRVLRLSGNLFSGISTMNKLSQQLVELQASYNPWTVSSEVTTKCFAGEFGDNAYTVPDASPAVASPPLASHLFWGFNSSVAEFIDVGGSNLAVQLPPQVDGTSDDRSKLEVVRADGSVLTCGAIGPWLRWAAQSAPHLQALVLARPLEIVAVKMRQTNAQELQQLDSCSDLRHVDFEATGLSGVLPRRFAQNIMAHNSSAINIRGNQLTGVLAPMVAAPRERFHVRSLSLGDNNALRLDATALSENAASIGVLSLLNAAPVIGDVLLPTGSAFIQDTVTRINSSALCAGFQPTAAATATSQQSWQMRGASLSADIPLSCILSSGVTKFQMLSDPQEQSRGIFVDEAAQEIVDALCPVGSGSCVAGLDPDSRVLSAETLRVLDLRNVTIMGSISTFMRSICLLSHLKSLRLIGIEVGGMLPRCFVGLGSLLLELRMSGADIVAIPPQWSQSIIPMMNLYGIPTSDLRASTGTALAALTTVDISRTRVRMDVRTLFQLLLSSGSVVSLDASETRLYGSLEQWTLENYVQAPIVEHDVRLSERRSSARLAARVGGIGHIPSTMSEIVREITVTSGLFEMPARGFRFLRSLSLAFTLISGALPMDLPSSLRELNISHTLVNGSLPESYENLDVLDARGIPGLRGNLFPQTAEKGHEPESVLSRLPLVVQPLWTAKAANEYLGLCCELPGFLLPKPDSFARLNLANETWMRAEPVGEAECLEVYAPMSPLGRFFIPESYDNYARCRCAVGSYGFGRWCSVCPAGATTGAAGAQKLSDCLCSAGQVLDQVNSRCIDCPPDCFRLANGPPACEKCPLNSVSQAAAESSRDCECEPGYEATFGTDVSGAVVLLACSPCKAMHAKQVTSNVVMCQPCPVGSFTLWPATVACQPCDIVGADCSGRIPVLVPGAWAIPKARVPNPDASANPNASLSVESFGGPFMRCPNPAACIVAPSGKEHQCAPGYGGTACAGCLQGFSEVDVYFCSACPSPLASLATLFGMVISTGGVAILLGASAALAASGDTRGVLVRVVVDHMLLTSVLLGYAWFVPSGLARALSFNDVPGLVGRVGGVVTCLLGTESALGRQIQRLVSPLCGVGLAAAFTVPAGIEFLRSLRSRAAWRRMRSRDVFKAEHGNGRLVRASFDSLQESPILTTSRLSPSSMLEANDAPRDGDPCLPSGIAHGPIHRQTPPDQGFDRHAHAAAFHRAHCAGTVTTHNDAEGGCSCWLSFACGTETSVWLCTRPHTRSPALFALFTLAAVAYPSVIRWSLGQVSCESFGPGLPSLVRSDPTIACGEETHLVLRSVAYAVLALIGAGYPLCCSCLVVWLHWSGRLFEQKSLRVYGYLYQGLDPKRLAVQLPALTSWRGSQLGECLGAWAHCGLLLLWQSAIVPLRLFFLAVLLVSRENAFQRAYAAAALLALAFVLQLVVRPYQSSAVNALASASLAAMFATAIVLLGSLSRAPRQVLEAESPPPSRSLGAWLTRSGGDSEPLTFVDLLVVLPHYGLVVWAIIWWCNGSRSVQTLPRPNERLARREAQREHDAGAERYTQ